MFYLLDFSMATDFKNPASKKKMKKVEFFF